MELVSLKGTNLVRFVTSTQGWAELAGNNICVPDEWPYMMVELLIGEDSSILMSSAVGIPKDSVHAFQCQGLYYYEFSELPEAVTSAVLDHFKNIHRELLKRVDTLLPELPKPRLVLVKR